jgi:hypothetical protein
LYLCLVQMYRVAGKRATINRVPSSTLAYFVAVLVGDLLNSSLCKQRDVGICTCSYTNYKGLRRSKA